jgi:hypothetical protein
MLSRRMAQSRLTPTTTTTTTTSAPILGNDSYTCLMLRGDGSGTSFSDSSFKALSITTVGSVTQGAPQKWGSGAAQFSGTNGNYLSVPNITEFTFLRNPFTIDFWLRTTQTAGNTILFGHYATSSPYQGWYIKTNWPSGKVSFGNNGTDLASTTTVTDGVFRHVAITSDGTSFKLFINGVQEATQAATNIPQSGLPLVIGTGNTLGNPFAGSLDEIRISTICRWSSNFTVPAGPYT